MSDEKPVELCFRNRPSELLDQSKLHPVCLSLTELVARAKEDLAKIAEEHGVRLTVELYFELNPVSGRESRDGSN